MLVGVCLDNVDSPPESSYRRIRLMRAEVALTLWTAGTRHRRPVYESLLAAGVRRVCVRVGDERIAGSVADYLHDVDQAVNEAAWAGFAGDEIDCQVLNEPNLGPDAPEAVGAFVGDVVRGWRRAARIVLPPVSRGKEGWREYARTMMGATGVWRTGSLAYGVHAYAHDAENLLPCDTVGAAVPCVVTEFSHPELSGRARGLWVVERLKEFSAKGYGYAVQFIVDGVTGGAWPEAYRMSDEEAVEIGARGALPEPREQPVTIPGIDVSNHQGHIDWTAVRASGVRFAFIKASEDSDFVDQFFLENWSESAVHELVRGAYHFARPSASSPAASVTHFQRRIDAVGGLRQGDLIALDIEDERIADGSLHLWVAEWLDLAARVFGVRPFKYSGHWYTRTRDLEHDDLAAYPTWWAAFQDVQPAPVTGWGPIRCWQHSAGGRVPGIAGDCDLDVFDGTADELRALGYQGVAPRPEPCFDESAVRADLDALWGSTRYLAEKSNRKAMAVTIQKQIIALKGDLGLA